MKKESNKKPAVRVRLKQIKFYITESEREQILKRASGFNSLSEYLRYISRKGKIVKRPPSISLDHYTELNRIGNNINQIAKRINSAEANIFHVGTKKELEKMIDELKTILHENNSNLKKLISW